MMLASMSVAMSAYIRVTANPCCSIACRRSSSLRSSSRAVGGSRRAPLNEPAMPTRERRCVSRIFS
jgi:hypothetical protein